MPTKSKLQKDRERLLNDLKRVSEDAEQLLKDATSRTLGTQTNGVREEIRSTADDLQEQLMRVRDLLSEKAGEAEKAYDYMSEATESAVSSSREKIRETPFAAVGIAAGAGLLVGLLAGIRRD